MVDENDDIDILLEEGEDEKGSMSWLTLTGWRPWRPSDIIIIIVILLLFVILCVHALV